MAAGKWKVYNLSKQYLVDGTLDLDDTTNWKMALFTSTSNADTLSLATPIYGNLTNELANGSGYTTGGIALTGIALSSLAGTTTFTCNSPQWNASGTLTFRFAVIYKDATVNSVVKPLLCVCLLDTTPADITVTAGNSIVIQINASGVITISGANSN